MWWKLASANSLLSPYFLLIYIFLCKIYHDFSIFCLYFLVNIIFIFFIAIQNFLVQSSVTNLLNVNYESLPQMEYFNCKIACN